MPSLEPRTPCTLTPEHLMPANRSLITENAAERERLRTLVSRLSDADLKRSLGGGWMVATALAHVAFWDRRALGVLERWERGEAPDSVNSEHLNEALLPEWLALPPRDAARLAVEAAEAVDRKVAALAAGVIEQILATGESWRLTRAVHRREHLDQIERVLGG